MKGKKGRSGKEHPCGRLGARCPRVMYTFAQEEGKILFPQFKIALGGAVSFLGEAECGRKKPV